MRTTKPEQGNKYYITKGNGGWSNAIRGSPTDAHCDVLSNCVGYAYGRFNEIGGYGYCKYLSPVNAENFMQYKGSLSTGQTPQVGACMVWQKGATLNDDDGAGHVAIVEKVISNTEVITSESGWGSATPFWTQTRKKGSDGRWGMGAAYTFLGFIYNPAASTSDASASPPTTPATPVKLAFKIGDIVEFTGTTHYASSTAKVGSKCVGGKAKITYIAENANHPYHCVRIEGTSATVYGWVDAAYVQATTAAAEISKEESKKEENKMSNSTLVSYKKISPNKNSPRSHAIDTITIHCVVGQCSVEALGEVFASTSREASSNYGIGYDGKIGMYVEEKDRSWCSSNSANDNRAITIEVASDTTHPYAVNDKAYAALIDLVTDICKRNGIKKLVWSTDKNKRVNHLNGCNMTVHRDYANKSCPGDYLYNRHGDIAAKVNARLTGTSGTVTPTNPESTKPVTPTVSVKVGDVIKLKQGAVYISGQSVPQWVINSTLYAREIRSNKQIVFSTLKTGAITGVITPDQLVTQASTPSTPSNSGTNSSTTVNYLVRITTDALNIRKGPSTNYSIVGCIRDRGVYTIVEQNGDWGKLKSGAGWISLTYTKKV